MAFNPNEHLMKLGTGQNAQEYLQVKWRLAWFRDQCPTGSIETEIIKLDLDREVSAEVMVWSDEQHRKIKVLKTAKGYCVCRAIVKDGNGGVGTGTKSEAAVDFGDFIEKAESGAIGRALATLGYGTQFTGDEFDERHRIVDSPVDRGEQQSEQAPATTTPKPQAAPATASKPVETPFRPAGATEQAFTRMVEKCEQIAGEGKGQGAYQRIRTRVAGDLPDDKITDQHLTEMWTMINAAGKKPMAKAS
jgi:hypothetical protein